MSDYEQIRKRYLAGESQRSIAKSLGISRNTVAKYCKGAAVPWERKTPERDSTVLTDEVSAFILSCLEEDQQVSLKKQKHTAKIIIFDNGRVAVKHGVGSHAKKQDITFDFNLRDRCRPELRGAQWIEENESLVKNILNITEI